MGWHYRTPQSFPAMYLASLREASENPNQPHIMIQFKSEAEAKFEAERFRWFRWCIRQDLSVNKEMSMILQAFDIRCEIKSDYLGHMLEVVARPTKFASFVQLNPDLAAEILPQCQ